MSAFAQKPDLKFRHITREQGLSQTHVIYIAQDCREDIWICTANGLNKRDRTRILPTTTREQMMAVLPLNKIRYKAGVMSNGLLETEETKSLNYNVILVDVQMPCDRRAGKNGENFADQPII